ncbi:MAG: hypothetical protein KY455_14295 [Euryarchaeota archaeon]|nr:hypothetical protein [Euryarchaeota archaeon]
MHRPVLAALVILVVALAGCVEETAPPAAPDPPPEGPPGGPTLAPEAPTPPIEPAAVPFATDGESPAGVWLCAIATVKGDCAVWWQDTGRFHHTIPHDGTVVGIDLTVTFTPATPELKGIVMFLGTGDVDDWTLLGTAEGPSGTTLSLEGLNVTADQTLSLQAWNMPDAEAGGAVWVDPVPQPYRIEGTLHIVPG